MAGLIISIFTIAGVILVFMPEMKDIDKIFELQDKYKNSSGLKRIIYQTLYILCDIKFNLKCYIAMGLGLFVQFLAIAFMGVLIYAFLKSNGIII